MLTRVGVIMNNTYREAVRARVLHGLLALALATAAYSLVVGEFASRSKMRVVGDLGAASVSAYSILVAIVLSATSLHRELELKTLFPILARPIRRSEYLVGKFAGTLLTLLVFIAANTGTLLLALAFMNDAPAWQVLLAGPGLVCAAIFAAWRLPRWRTSLPIPTALLLLALGAALSGGAPDERAVLLGSALLAMLETAIVASVAMLFASFSSPFLTAVFTFGVFMVGRSADTLANMPERVFGPEVKAGASFLSKVVPNLMVYVPPRTLLTGESGASISTYLGQAAVQSSCWTLGIMAFAVLVFRRRDFL